VKIASDAPATDEHVFIVTDFTLVASDIKESGRILDSRARSHFDPTCENFIDFHTILPRPIKSPDGRIFHAIGQGNVIFNIENGQRIHKITLKYTLYAPTMPIPLISIS
jgi:hypothetical protein